MSITLYSHSFRFLHSLLMIVLILLIFLSTYHLAMHETRVNTQGNHIVGHFQNNLSSLHVINTFRRSSGRS